jgi:acyl dehydratase
MEVATYLTPAVKALEGREDVIVGREAIGKGTVRRFAKAIGDPNPLYWDDEYARKSRYRGVIAPPTLIFELNHNIGGEISAEDGSSLDQVRLPSPPEWFLIRGGNEYEFVRPARPGDRVVVRRKIAEIYEKKGKTGPLVFVICEMTYSNHKGQVLGNNKETLIFVPDKEG